MEVKKINEPKVDDLYYFDMIVLDNKYDNYKKYIGIKKAIRYRILYKLSSYNSDSLDLLLAKKPFFDEKEFNFDLKRRITLSKNDLIGICDRFNEMPLSYSTFEKWSGYDIPIYCVFDVRR